MTSSLLIDEPPLQVLPSLAVAIGLNEALILQQIHYWLGQKKRSPDQYKGSFKQGEWWVYNSVPQWNEQFPFWGDNTIRRALASLREQGLLLTGQLADDKHDKTLWYRIDYAELEKLTASHHAPKGSSKKRMSEKRLADKWVDASTQNGQMAYPEWVDGSAQSGEMDAPILGASLSETSPETTKRIPQRIAPDGASEVLPSAVGGQDGADEAQTDEKSEEYRAAYRQARKAMAHPDFQAKHGRPSGPADWNAGAREKMQELRSRS